MRRTHTLIHTQYLRKDQDQHHTNKQPRLHSHTSNPSIAHDPYGEPGRKPTKPNRQSTAEIDKRRVEREFELDVVREEDGCHETVDGEDAAEDGGQQGTDAESWVNDAGAEGACGRLRCSVCGAEGREYNCCYAAERGKEGLDRVSTVFRGCREDTRRRQGCEGQM